MKEKVLDKVRKLLDKANSTSSEQEAMIFNQKAEELLTKWKIDQIELNEFDPSSVKVIHKDLDVMGAGKMATALAVLSKAVANHFGAEVYYSDSIKPGTRTVRQRTIKIVGYESDIESTELIYFSLKQQCLKFLQEAKKKDEYYSWYSNADKNTWDQSYTRGFASRINGRFIELKKEHEATIKNSTALVIRSREEDVKDELSKMSLRNARRTRVFGGAHNSGYADGNRADIGSTRIGNSHKQLV